MSTTPPRKTPQQVAAAKAAEQAAKLHSKATAENKTGASSQRQVKAKEGVLGKIEGDDWHRPPEEGELPPYKEAAMQAWEKAKEAGAGKFQPGGMNDNDEYHDRLRAPLDNQQQQQKQEPVPPPVRSVLTFGANSSMALSSAIKASPGIQGGLFYKNRSFCFSAGYRDGVRGMDADDKGNFLKMKDPLGMQRLSVVFFGHLVWLLHKEGHLDMFAPICTILPELKDRKFDGLFPRDILNFSCGMDDADVLKALDIRKPAFHQSYYDSVTKPLNDLFSPEGVIDPVPTRPKGSEMQPPPKFGACGPGSSSDGSEITAVKMGFLMRQNLVSRLGETAPKLPKMFKKRNPRPSHFAVSLLCAAIEKKMNEPMEELFRKKLTEPLGIMSVGFGIPQIMYRSSMFWQPTGLPHSHFSFKEHLEPGHTQHTASPIFNPSLNLFGNPEDTAKLLCDCFGSAREAVKEMPRSAMMGQKCYELGWMYVPHKKRFFCKTQWGNNVLPFGRQKSPVEYTPYAASAMYDDEKDAGAFCVTNCGSGKAQFLANFSPQVVAHLFIRQCIDTGMDLQPTDENGQVIEPDANPYAKKAAAPPKSKQQINEEKGDGRTVTYTNEGKEYRATTAATATGTPAAASNMQLTREEQIAEMKRLSEEQKEAADEVTNSWFGRAQRFFASGQINTDGYKRF